MAKFYKQVKGKLVEYDGEEECLSYSKYKYGTLNKEPYASNTIPKCNICGGELMLQKKKGYFLIIGCSNENCETNHCNKGADTKLIAFLPEEYYNDIRNRRKHKPWFDKGRLINEKGFTPEEADEFFENFKQNLSLKNKGHNKDYFIKKFGDRYLDFLRGRNHLCIEYWIKQGYSENEAVEKIKKIQSHNSSKVKNRYKQTRENIIASGIDPDTFYREKSVLCQEFWLKRGYSEEEASYHITQIQKQNSKKVQNHISNKTVAYWTEKGLTEDEAKNKISQLQSTFSLKLCIEKYGEAEGGKIWRERQEKWQKSLHENGKLHIGYSSVSQELFDEILKHYQEEEKDYVFYASKNREYSIKNPKTNYYFAYDFTDLNKRKIIEFNGDIYHGNPQIFQPNDTPNPFNRQLTTEDLLKKDTEKMDLAEKNGFKTLTIWESDYRNNKDEVIEKILNFIKDE